MKKIISNQSNVKAQQMPSHSLEQVNYFNAIKAKVKLILPTVTTVAFLGTWISLSLQHNNLHLKEALVCSFIIGIILFIRALEKK